MLNKETGKKLIAILINFQLVFAQNIQVITDVTAVNDYKNTDTTTVTGKAKLKIYKDIEIERNRVITNDTTSRNIISNVELNVLLNRGVSEPVIKDLKNIDEIKTGTIVNNLTKDELINNLNKNPNFKNEFKNHVYTQKKDITFKASITTGNISYDYDKKLTVKLGAKSKSYILEDTYGGNASEELKQDILLKDPKFSCKSKKYTLMERVKVNPNTKSEYMMDVFIKYKTNTTTGTRTIEYLKDIKGNVYKTTIKAGISYLINRNIRFVKRFKYMENSYNCVRRIKSIKSDTCSTNFVLNSQGICEKRFMNQPSPRKTTGNYYTCKKDLGNGRVGVSIALNDNLSKQVKTSCENIPTTNDRMYYTNQGDATCSNIFPDSKNSTINKFRYLTNAARVKNYGDKFCVWNTLGNYYVNRGTPLSNNQLYSITGINKAAEIPKLDFLEKGHTYAFILLSSGTAKLNKFNGLRRTATFGPSNTILNVNYKGNKYTAIANINSKAIANGYKYITYEDLANKNTIHSDFNEVYAEYKSAMENGSLEQNKVYKLDTKTNKILSIGAGHIKSDGKIWLDKHTIKVQNGTQTIQAGYYKTLTKKINNYVYEINSKGQAINTRYLYVVQNSDITKKVEDETSFTKIVLQDTFIYNGKKEILIPNPSVSWAYKLYIYDVNEFKKIIGHMRNDLYSQNTNIQKNLYFNTNSKLKSFPYKKEYTEPTCSNANLGAKIYKSCKIRATLFKTNLNSIKPKLVKNTCYTYYSYDNNNNNIKGIIENITSKDKLISNLNSKLKVFYETDKLNSTFKEIERNAFKSYSLLKSANDKMVRDLGTYYDITTTDGKKEVDSMIAEAIVLERDMLDIQQETSIIIDKLKETTSSNPKTKNEASNIISGLESDKISNYQGYKNKIVGFSTYLKLLIKKYEYKDEYNNAYFDFLNTYVKELENKLTRDFQLTIDKYNVVKEESKLFVEDVFSDTYKDKSGNTFRRLLSGDIIPLGKISLNSNVVTVGYKPACKLNGQLIDCDDEILKSKNICKNSEVGEKTFCPSGTTAIGGGYCAQENCDAGYSFRKFTFGKQSFLGCVKESTGSYGCESDKIVSNNVTNEIKYNLKYIKINGKNKLKCSSTPIFPKFSISGVQVSSALSEKFKFDSHTSSDKIEINSIYGYKLDEKTDMYNLTGLEGTFYFNSGACGPNWWCGKTVDYNGYTYKFIKGNVMYKWKPGYTHLRWYKTSQNNLIQPYSGKDKALIEGGKICHACGWGGSPLHGTNAYVRSYSEAEFFKDVSGSDLKFRFDCNGIINNGAISMYPALGKKGVYEVASNDKTLDIRSIPAKKMPVWCVNIKALDGCSNNISTIKDCKIANNSITTGNKNDNYCYLTRPKLSNSCVSKLFEYKKPVEAKCDLYNGFVKNAQGKCSRTTYSKSIRNKDYYCPIVPDRFNPFDGGQATFTIESMKNLANDSSKVTTKAKTLSFDIEIKRVSIEASINYNYNLNKKVTSKYNDDYVPNYKATSKKYYWNNNLKSPMYIPNINLHEYKTTSRGKSFIYVNDDRTPGRYNGFLLNKKLNKSFNFNSIDEKAMYQKNLFNVHIEDKAFEKFSPIMARRFGLIKDTFNDLTPRSLGSKYRCLYDYSIFELPDCNKGVTANNKQEYNISYNTTIRGYVCNVKSDVTCPTGVYDNLLGKCVINKNENCPEEIVKDGKVYRKSLGEIKQIFNNGSLSCKLKKLKCDDFSIEGLCPSGFEYDTTVNNDLITNACILKTNVSNLNIIKDTFEKDIKLSTVEICPDNKINTYAEKLMPSNLLLNTNWRVNTNNKCERTNYILSSLDTLHLRYNLSPVLNISKEIGKYNILSRETFRNNQTTLTATNLYGEGYSVKKGILSIPVIIMPTTNYEEVIFSLTGLGRPLSVKTLDTGANISYDFVRNNGVDVIKGFNDTDTMIINQKLSKGKPRLLIYSWDLNRIPNKTAKINYFCENAICGIIPIKNIKDDRGNKRKVFTLINNKSNVDKYISNVVYNKCTTAANPLQTVFKKNNNDIYACYNIEENDLIKTKKVTIVNQKVNTKFTKGKITRNGQSEDTLFTDVIFNTNKKLNNLCNYDTGWFLDKKSYTFASVAGNTKHNITEEYYVCKKEQDVTINSITETISLEKNINTINKYKVIIRNGKKVMEVTKTNIPQTTYINNQTDNVCYYGLLNNVKTISTDSLEINNYGVLGSNNNSSSSNGLVNYNNIGTKNFVINFEETNIYNENMKIKLKSKSNSAFDKPFYCVSGDKFLNNATNLAILNYSDINVKKPITLKNTISNFDLIAEYDNTLKSNELISYNFPSYISNIIIKEKNNRRPILSDYTYSTYTKDKTKVSDAEILQYSRQTDSIGLLLYDKKRGNLNRKVLNNRFGTPSLIDISKINNNRELCFVFDLKKVPEIYSATKNTIKNKSSINKNNKQKINKFYMAMPLSCEAYIMPYDKTKIAALLLTNKDFYDEYKKVTLIENSDFKLVLSNQARIDKEQLCIVKIKCPTDYVFNKVNSTCEFNTNYKANKYQYKEDYVIERNGIVKIVTLDVDDVNKTFDNITHVINAKKVPNTLREILICDNGMIPMAGGICSLNRIIPAKCKIPLYSNGKYVNYNLYNGANVMKVTKQPDEYYCSFQKPFKIMHITTVMPKIKIK